MPKINYPLAAPFMSRNASLETRDVYIRNGYIENYQDKNYVIKRPGTPSPVVDFGVTGAAQGTFFYSGFYYIVINDILYRSSGGVNAGSTGSAWTQVTAPQWAGRAGFGAIVFQNRIWVIGGSNFLVGASQPYANVYNSADGINWSAISGGTPFGIRDQFGLAVLNNQLVVVGGINNSVSVIESDAWTSPDGNNWTQAIGTTIPNGWGPRYGMGLISASGGLFLIAGVNGSFVNQNDVWFSSDAANWTQVQASAAFSARQQFVTLFFNNLLWVIGGLATGGAFLNDVWSSPDGYTWTQRTTTAFASARSSMCGCVYNNKMWVMGGITAASAPNSIADVYSSTDGVSWTLVTASPGFGARQLAQVVVFQTPVTVSPSQYQSMWILGGLTALPPPTSTGVVLQDVWYGNLNVALANSFTLSPTTTGQPYQFTTFVGGTVVVLKNQSNMWVLNAGSLLKIIDPNYPAVTVPGVVTLNLFLYVMTPQGVIYSSAIYDPTTWPALQFIRAAYEDDTAVYLVKYLNYVTALKTFTTQFFYDAANPPPGIALSAYTNANLRVGCANAQTVQETNNTVIFAGNSDQPNIGIYMLNGMSPQRVSQPWVDLALFSNVNANTTSLAFGGSGHVFYVLNFSSGPSLVFDSATQNWYVWDGGTTSQFPYTHASSTFQPGGSYLVGLLAAGMSGKLYSPAFNVYNDSGVNFTLAVQTDKMDAGTLARKFWGNVDIVSDSQVNVNSSCTVNVVYSDNDYQTFSVPRTVYINPPNQPTTRPRLTRWGSSRRRAWNLSQTDNNPARWESLEITYDVGES